MATEDGEHPYPLYVPVEGTADEFDLDDPENLQLYDQSYYPDYFDEYYSLLSGAELEDSLDDQDVNAYVVVEPTPSTIQKIQQTLPVQVYRLLDIFIAWRQDIATRFNVNQERIIKNEHLQLISTSDVTSMDDLARLSVPLSKRHTYGDIILDIIRKFKSGEAHYYSDYVRITPTLKYRLNYDLLYFMFDAWRLDMATRLDVPKSAVLPEYLITRIVKIKPTTEQDLIKICSLNKKWVAENHVMVLDMVRKYLAGEVRYYSDYIRKNISNKDVQATKFYVMPPNQRKKKWDESELSLLMERYKAGESIEKVATDHGRLELEVGLKLAQLLLNDNIIQISIEADQASSHTTQSQRRGYKWSDEEDRKLELEYANGITLKQIAERHQRSRFSVICRATYLGIDIIEILDRINKEQG